MTEWLYNDAVFIPPDPNPYEGFIYIIENLSNGKKYIGKKHFWSRRKNKKTNRRVTRDSDWREYYGSSDDLTKDIEALGKEHFKRTILHLCVYKKQMTFLEQKEQWEHNVLLRDDYYNTNIGGKFFVRERHIFEKTVKEVTSKNDKWRKNKSLKMMGDNNMAKRPDIRKKISDKKKGKLHHQFGKPISDEHKEKLHSAARDAVIKTWEVTTPTGTVLTIQNLLEYCRRNDLTPSAMCWVAQGKRKHHKGYTCREITSTVRFALC